MDYLPDIGYLTRLDRYGIFVILVREPLLLSPVLFECLATSLLRQTPTGAALFWCASSLGVCLCNADNLVRCPLRYTCALEDAVGHRGGKRCGVFARQTKST